MEKNLVFCEKCRNEVDYIVKEVELSAVLKSKEYHYIGKEAYCVDCNSLVDVPEFTDYNLKALYDVYRTDNNLVSLETIRAIPEKYSIGKRPLSLLLGWGEQTFTRYYEGDIPSKQYSDILIKIYNEPAFYAELLEAGKSNLKTVAPYEKSKKAVDTLQKHSIQSCESKISMAVRYLLMRCGDMTPLSLQKALYYIQGFYSAFYGAFLFSEDCEAWMHGPVYRDIYFQYRDYKFDPITPNDFFDESAISTQEKAIFDSIADNFCCYSGKVLEQFTHSEAPWLNIRGDLPANAPSERIIPRKSIEEYFSTVKARHNMVNPSDIRAYAQKMFYSL